MNGPDHQNATTTQARADIRALLAEVPDKLHPKGKWFPGRGLGVLADLLIGKWYACDPTRRQANGVEWPPADLSKMADDVEEALAFYSDDDSLYLDELTAVRMFEQGDSRGLADILDWLRGLDLSTPAGRRLAADVFDEAVRFMVHRHGESLGQFVTPAPVVDLMVALANPAPGEKVYDPCFGFGGLLVEALRRTRGVTDASSAGQEVGPAAIAGIESDWQAYPVGLCRLVLAGVDRPDLTCGDALARPLPDDLDARGYDCILAAPPWGDDDEPADYIEDRFLRHVMGHLRPGARAVIAVPEHMLLRDESIVLRKELLEEYRVDGVISAPSGALEPHTSIAMGVVVFRRAEPRDTVRVALTTPAAWDAAVTEAAVGADGQNESGLLPARRFDAEALRAISDAVIRRGELPAGARSAGALVWDAPRDAVAHRYSRHRLEHLTAMLLESSIDEIAAADPSLAIERLSTVAETGNLINDWDEDEFLSPGDLVIHFGTLFAEPEIKPEIMIVGDFTRIAGTYEWEINGPSAASVRVRDRIKPEFLAAILGSPAYSHWLSCHALDDEGEMSARALDELRIPAPPPVVQDAVLEELDGPGADALAVLHRLLAEVSGHPAALWLEKPLPARLAAGGGEIAGASDGLKTLAETGRGLGGLSQPVDSTKGSPPLDAWLSSARRAAAALDGIDSIPSGSGRLAVLEFALVRLHEALAALGDAEGHVIERLRKATEVLVRLAEHEVYTMQRSITLDLDVEPIEVVAGDASELIVRATNASAVPLRNLRLAARRPDGKTEERATDYVAEGGEHNLRIAVHPTGEERSLQIAVEWQARRFDGKPVRGDGAVTLLVRESGARYRAGTDQDDLGFSPYIVGNPVDRDEMFFGRERTMEQIRRQLGGGHANVVLLEGNRRTGKTSILKRLENVESPLGWIPVYCSFQDVDSVATADVFRLFARRTGEALADAGIETWMPDLPRPDSRQPFKRAFRDALMRAFYDGHPFETLEVYLATALEAAKPRRILLMIDEFDKLQEGIDGGITSPQVPENIRHLLQHQPDLGAIITGSRRLKRLREEYWSALFGFGHRIGVSALPKEDARRLVTEPVAGLLRYLPQARDRLVELCACHPFLVQSICNRVFEQAATGGAHTITLDIVEQAAAEMVRDNEHFQTLWGYAGSERRRLVLALCDRLAAGADAVNVHLLRREFLEHGVRIRRDTDLADDVAELRELELVDFDESYRNGTYRLSTPLMATWLRKNVDFDDLVVRARQEAQDAT